MKGRFDSMKSNEGYWFVYSHKELYWCCLWPFPKITASTCSVYYFTLSLLLPQHETEKNYVYQVLLLRSRSVVVPRFSNDKVFEDKFWWGIQLLSKTLNAAIYSLHHVCTAHCQETVSSFSTNRSWRSWQNGETTGQDYGIAQKLASERWMCWRGLVRMEQRQRKRSKKWNSPKKELRL